MQRSLRGALAILVLLLFPAVSLCPCAMIGSTRESVGGTQGAPEQGHCSRDRTGGTRRTRPEGPCGSETCRHCPTDLVGVPHAYSASSLTLTVLPVCGGTPSIPFPALSAARATSVAGDLPPPNLSRPVLELNCCFLI